MKKLALILFAATSLLGSGSIASAQYYGGGYYGAPGPGYRYYDGGYYGGRGYGYGGAMIGQNNYGQPERWYPVGRYGTCPRVTRFRTVSANGIGDIDLISGAANAALAAKNNI